MNDISIGAVGAAFIAGLVSLMSLVISKEQKVSDFRQAWINDLRDCVILYLVNINAICDTVRLKKVDKSSGQDNLLEYYRLLNQASHGIKLRVNDKEQPAKDMLAAMEQFEKLSEKNEQLTPENIRREEQNFCAAAKTLLKFEWKRVKRGENIYRVTKWAVILGVIFTALFFVYTWWMPSEAVTKDSYPLPFQFFKAHH
ncbi:hypothetical protein [Paracoccus endophyticus]|uniref:hypothetical protein n=1 Tax=Paracoccus endophyticus TaxID=2233774 RepID=UPI0013A6DE88|nr:hypothetical protein [Paracoccus endophyticus]